MLSMASSSKVEWSDSIRLQCAWIWSFESPAAISLIMRMVGRFARSQSIMVWPFYKHFFQYSSPKLYIIDSVIRIRGTPTFGSRPKQNPKSMWNRDPCVVIIRLSKCRSPKPKNQLIAPLNAMLSISLRRIDATDTPSLWSQINSKRVFFFSTNCDKETQLGTICMATISFWRVTTSYHTYGNVRIPCSLSASLQVAMEYSIIRSTDPDSRFQSNPRRSRPHRSKVGRVALGNTLTFTWLGSSTSFQMGQGIDGILAVSWFKHQFDQTSDTSGLMSYFDAREDGI